MLRSCFRRGDADASTTRLLRSRLRQGMSRGSRGGGPAGLRGDSIASLGAVDEAFIGVGILVRASS